MKSLTCIGVLAALVFGACASDRPTGHRPPKDHQGARLVRDQFARPRPASLEPITGQVRDSFEAWGRFFRRVDR